MSSKQRTKSSSAVKQGSKQNKGQSNSQALAAQKAKKEAWRQQLEATTASPQTLAAEEAKKEARRQRQQAAQAAAQKRKRAGLLRRAAILAAAAIVVVGGIAAYAMNEANKPGELVAMQPSPHISAVTDAHAPYTTDPPTSGPHVQQVPNWTVYTEPISKELQVHALEDAGVVINYRPDLDKATVDRLAALSRSYSDHAGETKDNIDNHVMMSPYPGLSNAIVLTAWRRIQRLDTFDEAVIKRFIDTYKNHDHHGESGS